MAFSDNSYAKELFKLNACCYKNNWKNKICSKSLEVYRKKPNICPVL